MPEISTGHHRKALDKRRKIENNALVIVCAMEDFEAPSLGFKAPQTGNHCAHSGEPILGASARSGVALMVIAADSATEFAWYWDPAMWSLRSHLQSISH